jgi:hypothetical protein
MPKRGFANRQVRLSHALGLLGTAATTAEAIELLCDHARIIAACDGITVIQRDGDEVAYVAEDAVSKLWTGQRFPIGQCIAGLAIMAGEPILIPDIRNDARVPLNAYLATFVASMAIFPIGRSAAIGAYWQHVGPIDEETMDMMAQLAQAAAAIFDPLAPPAQEVG